MHPISQQPWCTLHNHHEIESQVAARKGEKIIEPLVLPVVLVTKKNCSQRLCLHYCQLNAALVKDAFPLLRVEDSLAALSGSTLDLASCYWQVAMGANTHGKAASETPSSLYLYEWNVMPFSPYNSPSTFIRLMEIILRGFY